MGCPGLNNIKLPIKWPKSKAVKIVERSCDKAFSSLEQRGKELAYCSRPLGRIEKGGDLGLWSIHTEQKEPRWFQATWHQGKGHAKVTKSMISVFYVAVFTFFFITSWHSLRPEEMWRVAGFQKSEKSEEKPECHHFCHLFFKIWTMISLTDGNSITRLSGNILRHLWKLR